MNRLLTICLMCLLNLSLARASAFNLNVGVSPEGAGSVSNKSGQYEEGTGISLSTSNHTGYVFTGWYDGDELVSGSTSFKYTMPGRDVTLLAVYEFDPKVPENPDLPEPQYSLSLAAMPEGSGSFNRNTESYKAGESVSLRAYPSTGYRFLRWEDEQGETLSSQSDFRYVMPEADVRLYGIFEFDPEVPGDPNPIEKTYSVTLSAKPEGAGSFNRNSASGKAGSEVNLRAYPSSGYRFVRWEDEHGNALSDGVEFNYSMPGGDSRVYGIFEFDPEPPSNPNKNYWNSETGELIIDNFTRGRLYDEVNGKIGYDNFPQVSTFIVKGMINENDFGVIESLSGVATVDLSRTGGIGSIPSYGLDNLNASGIILPSCVSSLGDYVFRRDGNLTSITLYSQEPPVCTQRTFSEFTNKDNCTIFVAASAIELYSNADYWKDFTILPITSDAHLLEVMLPDYAADGRYRNYVIEIRNLRSGTRQRYVVSDRMRYAFNGLQKEEVYNVSLLSNAGLELARIENVVIPDEDIEVVFTDIMPLFTADAIVKASGKDVTKEVRIEWLLSGEDGTQAYLRQSSSVGEIPEGERLICRVSLPQELAMLYHEPGDTELLMEDGDASCEINLEPFRSVILKGKVADGDGNALQGASVAATQTLNGKYHKTFTARTARDGSWTMSVFDAPLTLVTYTASECVNVTDTIEGLAASVEEMELGGVVMKSIVGARINYGFTYHAAGEEEVSDYYDDYLNVAVSVYNVTQNRPHKELSLQYPLLAVLDENINPGDELRLTATSKTNSFRPVEKTVKVDAGQRGEVTFDIVGKGGISASFEMTDNPAVVAMLYSGKGELLKKTDYNGAKALFTGLDDGVYTLVSMGKSDLMNSVLRLSGLEEIGLSEGKEYVKEEVMVKSGELTTVVLPEVPSLDESLFYYTNDVAGFTANKSSLTTGNYLTLRSVVDFKPVYKPGVSNVKLVVDLPQDCEFVEQSVIQGPNVMPYTIDNNRLEIQLGDTYQAQTRFCVVPTKGGDFNATASVVFDLDGKTVTQPIGTAVTQVKDLEINLPTLIATKQFMVRGIAPAKSKVAIYIDRDLIGECVTSSIGNWEYECQLADEENYREYVVFAKIKTPNGNILESESKKLTYNDEATVVNSVTMINQAHPAGSLNLCEYTTVFDFQGYQEPETYWYWPSYPKFTFMTDITPGRNDSICNVKLFVLTTQNKWISYKSFYDDSTGKWISCADFNSNNLPVNVGIGYSVIKRGISIEELGAMLESDLKDKGSTEIDDKYEVIEDEKNGLIKFIPTDSEVRPFILREISVISSNEYSFKFEENGINKSMNLTLSGENILPSDIDEFQINADYSIYTYLNSGTDETALKLYYPIGFLNKLKSTPSNDCFAFIDMLEEYAEGREYAVVSYSLVSENTSKIYKSVEPGRPDYDAVIDYLDRLPDSFECDAVQPIIDKMRKKVENAKRRNEEFGAFRNCLDWFDRGFKPTGTVGKSAMAAVNTGNKTVEVGQNIGNYHNGLEFRNDIAQMEAVGCLPEDGDSDPPVRNPNRNAGYVMDPSGYVYEAVPSNRVEGVQATIYYKETKEDMYGDPYDEVILWDAEEYAQKNPLFTDADGMYQWDVPQGLWQVKFEKDGYATAFSEWLPVPPPQLDVNIPIVQSRQPEVIEARAYEDGVEVQFDKFMIPSSLTPDNVFVTADGKKIKGDIQLVDSEVADPYAADDASSDRFASRLRFVPETRLSNVSGEVRLTVSRNVLSYAGVPMAATYSQILDIEKEIEDIVADDVKALYGGEKRITVHALPFDASAGRKLHVASSSELILSVMDPELILDEEGKGVVRVKGNLPGRAQLTFSIEGVTATGSSIVDVVTEIVTAEPPVASRANGSTVYAGSKVSLTTDSKDGVIYFTTDGSCPCDENGTRRKYTVPVVIEEDTRILAMASVGDGDDDVSEVVEFTYKVKKDTRDYHFRQGWNWMSHGMYLPVPSDSLMAKAEVTRILGRDSEISRTGTGSSVGELSELEASRSYKVKATAAATVKLEGAVMDPSSPIPVISGTNWIGCPISQPTSLSAAFDSDCLEELDVVVGQKGFAQYDGNVWKGTLTDLEPGSGYMYYASRRKNLSFKSPLSTSQTMVPAKAPYGADVDIRQYPCVMPIVATLTDRSGKMLDNSGYEIYAYSGSECRGKGELVDGLLMISVYGDLADPIVFEAVAIETGEPYSNTTPLLLKEQLVGDIHTPHQISLTAGSGVDYVWSGSDVNVSFIGDKLYVGGVDSSEIDLVEVFDIDGHKVMRTALIPESGIDVVDIPAGVYAVVVIAKGNHTYHKANRR